MNTAVRAAILGLGSFIRYVAFGDGQRVETAQRDGIADASDVGSDFLEELLVNPALLTLARQRGELDCGGLRHVIVGYGNFNQIVVPAPSVHVSVYVEGRPHQRSVLSVEWTSPWRRYRNTGRHLLRRGSTRQRSRKVSTGRERCLPRH